ncbi:hypothetical protein SCLCIDRAFT_19621 [Scleroderma citrinum Foug A]|uniref:Uncharacterized protein n=1 Tax=Scleroderma citrinum Foug A TaxID=1036808 RepID=A0A0C3AXY2_9AGAM|nr:hypothetical protein SCLCIDRAFT_19621 [Scleroderma citrinum Foug A]
MDSGKLPNYRSSYLLRFHPYPRVKPSACERAMTALEIADDTVSSDDGISAPVLQSANSVFDLANEKQNLNDAIYAT